MGCCSSSQSSSSNVVITEPTACIDVRNGLAIDMSKKMWLSKIPPHTKTMLGSMESTMLSTHINQSSIEKLQACGMAPAAVSGLLVSPTMFHPHEPLRGIGLPSQFLDAPFLSEDSPHHKKTGKFDVHIFVLDRDGSGAVVELHGNAHVNPFSEDPRLPSVHTFNRDGTCDQLRWYYYEMGPTRTETGWDRDNLALKGPLIDRSDPTGMISCCALSHFKKFGNDDSTLCVPPQDSPVPHGAWPWEIPGASSLALELGAVVAATTTRPQTNPQNSQSSAGLLANQHLP